MAEKILNTRILMKIDTLENWTSSSLKLKEGELAFATVAASAGTGLTEPVVMVKIGTSEEKTFSELPWAFHAKASDVLSACKSEDALNTYIKNRLTAEGVATTGGLSDLAQRVTTAEGEIDTLQTEMDAVEAKAAANETAIGTLNGLVGDTAVATQIQNAINALSTVYAAKSLEKTVSDHIADTVAHVTSDDKIKWNNALQASDVVTGSANGTISVKGSDVAVKGLGSAAYTESTAYDAAGSAAAAESAAKSYADGLAKNYDAAGAAATAESNAKTYAKDYADGLADNYDAAGSAAAAEAAAKKHADDELARLVGTETVASQIGTAITNLDLANKYDAKGAAAAVDAKLTTHASEAAATYETKTDASAKLTEAKGYTDTEVAKVQGEVDTLETYVGTIPETAEATNIVAYIQEKTAGIATDTALEELTGRVADAEGEIDALQTELDKADTGLKARMTAAEGAIDAIEADYLKAADKTALQDQIDALDLLVGDESVSKQITDVTDPLAARVKAVEDDYLKAADKTELTNAIATAKQEAIATVLGEGTDEDFDTLKEVADWILSDTTGAAALQTDVAAIKADYLKAADKTELEGKITTAQNAADKAQGEVDALEGVVATKAAQSDLEALAGRVTTAEGKISTLEGEMDSAEGRLDALEGKLSEKTVAEDIATAIDGLKNGELKTMQGEIDAVEGRADALEAKAHEHANAEELAKFVDGDKAKLDSAVQTVTAGTGLTAVKTGTDVAINIDETVAFIFDCGTSAV